MHQSVRDAFFGFNIPLEDFLDFMYLDIKSLVTTGMGNLIDPIGLALGLPFTVNGRSATPDEVSEAWRAVKARIDLANRGGGAFRSVTNLRLSREAINTLVLTKLAANERFLKGVPEFSNFDMWPADAQLGLLSMAWAMGPAFAPTFPSFRAAVAGEDWDKAAEQSHMNDVGNPGLKPRNERNKILFSNAARVKERGLAIELLQFPKNLNGGAVTAAIDLRTTSGIQQALVSLGIDPGPVDGGDGPRTRAAIMSFQTQANLTPDGIAGPMTRAALGAALDTIGVDHNE